MTQSGDSEAPYGNPHGSGAAHGASAAAGLSARFWTGSGGQQQGPGCNPGKHRTVPWARSRNFCLFFREMVREPKCRKFLRWCGGSERNRPTATVRVSENIARPPRLCASHRYLGGGVPHIVPMERTSGKLPVARLISATSVGAAVLGYRVGWRSVLGLYPPLSVDRSGTVDAATNP